MIRKLLSSVGLLILILAVTELIGLGYLYYGLKNYPKYWQGRANQQGEFLYIALGDSAAQAVGASRPANGYVGLLATSIQQKTGKKVRVVNLSTSGARLSDALRDQTSQLAKYNPDLVTIEIGANNMRDYNSEQFREQFEKVLQALPPGKSVISDMPYFGGKPVHTSNARDANQTIQELAARYNLPIAKLYQGLVTQQTPLIYASDFFHPNNRGYTIWHDAFWPQVEPVISK